MTDNQTTLLGDRLLRLADDMTPPVDVVGQVREARDRHRRRRRGQWALAAVATATAGLVVGTTVVISQLSVAPDRGEVAVPSESVPPTTQPVPTTPTPSPEAPPVLPAPETETAVTWPADVADLRTGGSFYVVFVAMAPEGEWATLTPLAEELYALGYSTSTGEACAAPVDGSELPFDWSIAPMFVSVHFGTEQAAQQFVATYEEEFGRQVTGVFHVWPYCL